MDDITTEYDPETRTWTVTWDSAPVTVTAVLSVDEAVQMARSILDRSPDDTGA